MLVLDRERPVHVGSLSDKKKPLPCDTRGESFTDSILLVLDMIDAAIVVGLQLGHGNDESFVTAFQPVEFGLWLELV